MAFEFESCSCSKRTIAQTVDTVNLILFRVNLFQALPAFSLPLL